MVFTWSQECWYVFTEWHFPAFYQVFQELVPFCMTTRPVFEKFSKNSVKHSTQKKCFQSFLQFCKLFSGLFQYCTMFSTRFSLQMTCLQSPIRWNISKHCLFWNYCGYSFICFTACLHLVKGSTVYVFLGRGLLVQESESQGDQYLFEICPVEHFAQNCRQIAISCVSSFFPIQFTACPS